MKQKIIFILGCARSGTCWLGNILQSHSQINGTIEHPDIFPMVTDLALNLQRYNELYPKIVEFYQQQLQQDTTKHYMDKSHPNLWIAKQLSKTFSNALFIGIIRQPLATISSMKKHYSVVSWHKEWEKYPTPNNFLGITKENVNCYSKITPIERHILQLNAHNLQMEKLKIQLGSKLFVIKYEELIKNNTCTLLQLTYFLELSSQLTCEKIKKESLYKWKTNLTQEEIDMVQEKFK